MPQINNYILFINKVNKYINIIQENRKKKKKNNKIFVNQQQVGFHGML